MDWVGHFGYDGSFLCCYRCRCFFDDDNYVVKLVTHVDRLKVRNRLSAIAIDNYRCSTRPGRSIARCKNDDGKCNMKIIRLKTQSDDFPIRDTLDR